MLYTSYFPQDAGKYTRHEQILWFWFWAHDILSLSYELMSHFMSIFKDLHHVHRIRQRFIQHFMKTNVTFKIQCLHIFSEYLQLKLDIN